MLIEVYFDGITIHSLA